MRPFGTPYIQFVPDILYHIIAWQNDHWPPDLHNCRCPSEYEYACFAYLFENIMISQVGNIMRRAVEIYIIIIMTLWYIL